MLLTGYTSPDPKSISMSDGHSGDRDVTAVDLKHPESVCRTRLRVGLNNGPISACTRKHKIFRDQELEGQRIDAVGYDHEIAGVGYSNGLSQRTVRVADPVVRVFSFSGGESGGGGMNVQPAAIGSKPVPEKSVLTS